MKTPAQPSRQVRRAQVRQKPHAQNPDAEIQRRTDEIVAEGKAKAAAAAATITHATLTDAELAAWRQDMDQRLQRIEQNQDQNLGHIAAGIHGDPFHANGHDRL